MCVESEFIQNRHFQSVFGLGFWGFGFALAVLVCLWALWCSRVSCIHVFSPVWVLPPPFSWSLVEKEQTFGCCCCWLWFECNSICDLKKLLLFCVCSCCYCWLLLRMGWINSICDSNLRDFALKKKKKKKTSGSQSVTIVCQFFFFFLEIKPIEFYWLIV